MFQFIFHPRVEFSPLSFFILINKMVKEITVQAGQFRAYQFEFLSIQTPIDGTAQPISSAPVTSKQFISRVSCCSLLNTEY